MSRDVQSLFPDLDRDLQSFSTGILPSQEIESLIDKQAIRGPVAVDRDQVQPASIDLRLGATAFRVRASFLTGAKETVARKIADLCMHEIDLSRPAVLEKGCVYIIPLMEELHLTRDISGKANPKSTTGRLDIFTRLITDYGTEFERVPAGYKGRLYVEVEAAAGSTIIGYKAKKHAPLVDLSKVDHYDPSEFWDPIVGLRESRLVLDPNDFYILVSKEKIRVPPHYAAEMVAYDPSVGEFRIHYAGFFDPGFGYGSDDIRGTRAVLEVRSHEVPFLIESGQTVGRLIYERLLAKPKKIYGSGIGSSYQSQGLALSKQFKRMKFETGASAVPA